MSGMPSNSLNSHSSVPWAPAEIRKLTDIAEVQITTRRPDGRPFPWTPIWVVVVDDQVYVRTWHRRTTGWYGRAIERGRAVIALDRALEVIVTEIGTAHADAINDAYRSKYGPDGAASMITPDSEASTLHLAKLAALPNSAAR